MNFCGKALILSALSLGFLHPLRAADVTGKWKAEFETPVGQMKYTYDLTADGANVKGKAIREQDGNTKIETEIKEGKISGDTVSFVEPLKIQDMDIRIEYKGKLAGDEIKFTRQVGDFGSNEFVAKRAKDDAPMLTGKWQAEYEAPFGLLKYVFEFKADGTNVTGKAIRDRDGTKTESDIKEGSLKGDTVSFVELAKIQDQDVRIEFSGKIAGDEIKLHRKVADRGEADFTAKRVKDTGGK